MTEATPRARCEWRRSPLGCPHDAVDVGLALCDEHLREVRSYLVQRRPSGKCEVGRTVLEPGANCGGRVVDEMFMLCEKHLRAARDYLRQPQLEPREKSAREASDPIAAMAKFFFKGLYERITKTPQRTAIATLAAEHADIFADLLRFIGENLPQGVMATLPRTEKAQQVASSSPTVAAALARTYGPRTIEALRRGLEKVAGERLGPLDLDRLASEELLSAVQLYCTELLHDTRVTAGESRAELEDDQG